MKKNDTLNSHILVIDDVAPNLEIARAILRKAGFQVSIAKSGSEGLKLLKQTSIDLILLDIMMPGMDGFEVAATVKGMEKYADLPIIFLTARNDEESLTKGFELGAVDYITKPYVGSHGKPIIDYLNEALPEGDKASLLAWDGARMGDIYTQLKSIPKDTTQIFLSIGGNNIRQYMSFLDESASSVVEVLNRLHEMRADFEREYFALLEKIKEIGLPITVCTIYNCYFEDEEKQRGVETALAVFNDAIIHSAYRLSMPYIDLRDVCTEPSDYVNRIEPSDSGGRKIAGVISKTVSG